jgi:hypothetical protein
MYEKMQIFSKMESLSGLEFSALSTNKSYSKSPTSCALIQNYHTNWARIGPTALANELSGHLKAFVCLNSVFKNIIIY